VQQRQMVAVDGRRLAYLRHGPAGGMPVVLLHGGGFDEADLSWGETFARLSPLHDVIAPDWPGHGMSEGWTGRYRVADLGRVLLGLLDRLELQSAILVGVSVGGAAALWAALNHPGRVAGVVPVASYGLTDRPPFHPLAFPLTRLPLNCMLHRLLARSDALTRLALLSVVSDRRRITPELLARVQEISGRGTAGLSFDRFIHAEYGARGLATSFLSDLPRLSPPALFIHGRRDVAVPIAAARRAARAAGASLVELDAGHWPMVDAPVAFAEALDPFLARCMR
jgi:pimeloyl-ACP methyl ester carboxylesterase